MKKKLLIIFSLIFLFCSFSSNKLVTIKGHINSYGNMPFNYPAIETVDNKIIKIKEGKYSKEELLRLQAHLLEITGYISKEKHEKSVEYFIEIDDIKILK